MLSTDSRRDTRVVAENVLAVFPSTAVDPGGRSWGWMFPVRLYSIMAAGHLGKVIYQITNNNPGCYLGHIAAGYVGTNERARPVVAMGAHIINMECI